MEGWGQNEEADMFLQMGQEVRKRLPQPRSQFIFLSHPSQAHRSQPQRAESLAGRFLHRSPGEAPIPSSLSPSMSPVPQPLLLEGGTCPFSASVGGPASLGTLRWVRRKKSRCTLRWWGMSSGEEGGVEGA